MKNGGIDSERTEQVYVAVSQNLFPIVVLEVESICHDILDMYEHMDSGPFDDSNPNSTH